MVSLTKKITGIIWLVSLVKVSAQVLPELPLNRSYALRANGSHVCSHRVAETERYQVQVSYTHYTSYRTCCGHILGICLGCTRQRTETRHRWEPRTRLTYRTVYRCCQGWRQQEDQCPIPICDNPGCVHGRCVAPDTCDCSDSGYSNSSGGCNVDVDDCQNDNGGCDQICHNRQGLPRICSCRRGFILYDALHCKDVNECSLHNRTCVCADAANNPSCNASCLNSIGSYRCLCSENYRPVQNRMCLDVDECEGNRSRCSQICQNLPGSFRCSCLNGYYLDSDNTTCADINECNDNINGCEQICNNTEGGFKCSCGQGFVLDSNNRTCSDIDECKLNGTHECQHKCNNFHGSYFCTCYDGYKLNSDKKTCSDIDECYSTGHGNQTASLSSSSNYCSQLCNNTIGTYHCSCRKGYALNSDGRTCQDIDECVSGSHQCNHYCTNTIGSYQCSCQPGYRLADDKKACTGLPCEGLPPLINGNATCLTGTTNQSCEFSCDNGFKLEGSAVRRCLPSHKWSGRISICSRRSCPRLIPPLFGSIQFPCYNFYEVSCKLKCSKSYYLQGASTLTCELNRNNTMFWTNKESVCKKITICEPNPCYHGGRCLILNENSFQCDCVGTGYSGKNCEIGLIGTPVFPILKRNVTYTNLTIRAKPDKQLVIELHASTNYLHINPRRIEIIPPRQAAHISLYSEATGLFFISYRISGLDAPFFTKPKNSVINVKGGNKKCSQPLVLNMVSEWDVLLRGCHKSSGGRQNMYITSSDIWTKGPEHDEESTNGVVLQVYKHALLPLSLVGGNITKNTFLRNKLTDTMKLGLKKLVSSNQNTSTNSQLSVSSNCSSFKPSVDHLDSLLTMNTFGKTVAATFNSYSPYWFNIELQSKPSSFNVKESEAVIYLGKDILNYYPNCYHTLQLSDVQAYHLYVTKQTLLIYDGGRAKLIANGQGICIVYSYSDEAVYFAFLSPQEKALNWAVPTGWSGEVLGLGFTGVGKADKQYISGYGNFTLNSISKTTSSSISFVGYMKWTISDANKLFKDGASLITAAEGNGHIKLSNQINVYNATTPIVIEGNGTISSRHFGKQLRFPNQTPVVTVCTFKKPTVVSLGTVLSRIIQAAKSESVKVTYKMHEFAGEMKGLKNISYLTNTVLELRNLTLRFPNMLQNLTYVGSILSSDVLVLRRQLKQLNTIVSELSREISQLSYQNVLRLTTLVHTKLGHVLSKIKIIRERLQQCKLVTQLDSLFNKVDLFDESAERLRNHLQFEIVRNRLGGNTSSVSLDLSGSLCIHGLCFHDVSIKMVHHSDNNFFNTDADSKDLASWKTLISASTRDIKYIGEILVVPAGTKVYYGLSEGDEEKAWFDAYARLYENKLVTVTVSNRILLFKMIVNLRVGTPAELKVTSDLSKVKAADQPIFTVTGSLDETSKFLWDVNNYLDNYIKTRIAQSSQRIQVVADAVAKFEKQLQEAKVEFIKLNGNYTQLKENYENISQVMNSLTSRNDNAKGSLESHLNAADSKRQNYTSIIKECSPQLCLPKCVPGVITGLCSEIRYVHYTQQSCILVGKELIRVKTQQTSRLAYYRKYETKSNCRTDCPPLTGLFKNVFGRKRRSIDVKSLAKEAQGWCVKNCLEKGKGVVVDKVIDEVFGGIFEQLGGEGGRTGAKIGGMIGGIVGPKGRIIGSIIGGVVGSALGSCDETCKTTHIPIDVPYVHYGSKKVPEVLSYKEKSCKPVVKKKEAGFEHPKECLKQNNCSERISDVRCLRRNKECEVLREDLSRKIKEVTFLGPVYQEYVQTSLILEGLSLRKKGIFLKLSNEKSKLKLAEILVERLNQSLKLAIRSKSNIYRILTPETEMKQLAKNSSSKIMNITNGTFMFDLTEGMTVPKKVVLEMTVQTKSKPPAKVLSFVNWNNANESIADTARKIAKITFPAVVHNRQRRSIPANIPVEVRSSLLQNDTTVASKCAIIERNLLYLAEIIGAFKQSVAEQQYEERNITIANERYQNFSLIIDEMISKNLHCEDIVPVNISSTSNPKTLECNKSYESVAAFYKEMKSEFLIEQNSDVPKWKTKQSQIFATLELVTDLENFTECTGLRDCIHHALTTIEDLLVFDNSKIASVIRTHFPSLKESILLLTVNQSLTQDETRQITDSAIRSIKIANPIDVFCGAEPTIDVDLPERISVLKGGTLSLKIKVRAGLHRAEYLWRKDGSVIRNQTGNTLVITNVGMHHEGAYICEVNNRFGNVISAVSRVTVYVLPSVTENPMDIDTSLRSPLNHMLTCNGTGVPLPSFSWVFTPFDDTLDTSVLGHSNSSVLLIKTDGSMKSGFYQCNVSNEAGYALSNSAKVQILETAIAVQALRVIANVHSKPESYSKRFSASALHSYETKSHRSVRHVETSSSDPYVSSVVFSSGIGDNNPPRYMSDRQDRNLKSSGSAVNAHLAASVVASTANVNSNNLSRYTYSAKSINFNSSADVVKPTFANNTSVPPQTSVTKNQEKAYTLIVSPSLSNHMVTHSWPGNDNKIFQASSGKNELISNTYTSKLSGMAGITQNIESTFRQKVSDVTSTTTATGDRAHELPMTLQEDEIKILKRTLAGKISIPETRLAELNYIRQNEKQAAIGFTLLSKNITPMLLAMPENQSWNSLSNSVTVQNKGLFVVLTWMHFVFNNISNDLSLGNINITVDPDSLTVDPLKPRCPKGYRIHSNGFICEKCPAGTKFSKSDSCSKCPIGTFQPYQGQQDCMPCHRKQTTLDTGAVHNGQCVSMTDAPPTSSARLLTLPKSSVIPTLKSAKPTTTAKEKINIWLPLGIGIGFIVLLLGSLSISWCYYRHRKKYYPDILKKKVSGNNRKYVGFVNGAYLPSVNDTLSQRKMEFANEMYGNNSV